MSVAKIFRDLQARFYECREELTTYACYNLNVEVDQDSAQHQNVRTQV